MSSNFVEPKVKRNAEIDLFADKSALILYWLLKFGTGQESVSIREITRQTQVSIGLVQKVVESLVKNGILTARGVRTTKKFYLKNSKVLVENWTSHYNILKKCKVWTYSSGLSQNEILKILETNKFAGKTSLTLHSAAKNLNFTTTNLSTVELYLLDTNIKKDLEECLALEPKERGYDVLLIKPYYKAILEFHKKHISPEFLVFLDLYNFPLRGREQADYLARKIHWLKNLYVKNT